MLYCFIIVFFDRSDSDSLDNSNDNANKILASIYERKYGTTSEIYFDDNWVYM